MKKKNVVILLAVMLILVVLVSIGIYHIVIKNEKDYEIEEIKEYNYFIIKQDNQYGVMDKKGNTIISPEYSEIKMPNPEKAVFVCYQEEEIKVLNERKEQILTEYNKAQPIRLRNISSDLMYEKSVLKYEKDGKWGIINFEGKEITKPIYDEIDSLPYKEGELLVKQNEK